MEQKKKEKKKFWHRNGGYNKGLLYTCIIPFFMGDLFFLSNKTLSCHIFMILVVDNMAKKNWMCNMKIWKCNKKYWITYFLEQVYIIFFLCCIIRKKWKYMISIYDMVLWGDYHYHHIPACCQRDYHSGKKGKHVRCSAFYAHKKKLTLKHVPGIFFCERARRAEKKIVNQKKYFKKIFLLILKVKRKKK